MASTTYRVIQDSHQTGSVTREQVDKAIRAVMDTLTKKPSNLKKSSASSKARRAPSKK